MSGETNRRSEESDKEKAKRSDSCNKDSCMFRCASSGKCAFETCLLEELPPLQLKSMAVKCIFCGTQYDKPTVSTFTEDRVCDSCRIIIKKWIDKHAAIISHCESHASHG